MCLFFSSRRRHTRCALWTGVQTCPLPIWKRSAGAGPTASIGWKPIWTRRKGRTMEKLFETWSLEREIVLVKVLKHPRHKVFAAWMDPDALAQWYGPTGLPIEKHEADSRGGGDRTSAGSGNSVSVRCDHGGPG